MMGSMSFIFEIFYINYKKIIDESIIMNEFLTILTIVKNFILLNYHAFKD